MAEATRPGGCGESARVGIWPGREARQGAGRGGGSTARGRRVRKAAGWREKAGGAGGIWSVEFVARRGWESHRRGCATEPERIPEVSG